jgi:hypothetical protein
MYEIDRVKNRKRRGRTRKFLFRFQHYIPHVFQLTNLVTAPGSLNHAATQPCLPLVRAAPDAPETRGGGSIQGHPRLG